MKYVTTLIILLVFTVLSFAQPKYRTFTQTDLSQKKLNAGKVLNSNSTFVFKNDESILTVNRIYITFNSAINSIIDSGGFTTITLSNKNKTLEASGKSVAPGGSVTLSFNLAKKAPGAQASKWYWKIDNVQEGAKRAPVVGSYDPIFIQPNGGNVLEHIYKKIITRPEGLVFGKVTDTLGVGWIRYMKADRMYFPHIGAARGFDSIAISATRAKLFIGELKNPKVKKHDNHLLGETHALKLAIIANDSGATEPVDTTALGELIYNDLSNPSDPCNGLTIREITAFVDSALTYYKHFVLTPDIFAKLDTSVSRINRAFDGEYSAVTLTPFLLKGIRTVEEVPYLHPDPSALKSAHRLSRYSIIEELPETPQLSQNYPNPFNPSTTISFVLSNPGLVTLKIYDVLGREVATLLDKEQLEAGEQRLEYNADNLTSGIYFYRLNVNGGEYQQIKKMVLMK
jgi:hypothetical protein